MMYRRRYIGADRKEIMHQRRQGFLRIYFLKLLGESANGMSGYDLMKRIEEETGFWRPSPGSIYPLLAALEDEELIHHQAAGERRKKIYFLTEKGQEASNKTWETKNEARERIWCSIQVFRGIFREETPKRRIASLGRHRFAVRRELHKQIVQLRRLTRQLFLKDLTKEEVKGIGEILDEMIRRLREYVERD